jgi:threonine dehydrogenase-like Zn-dependent dehydrogenase
MKALVRVRGGGVAVAEQPDPRPQADEVIVSVHSCGICGSDVHMAEAGTGQPGGIPGHEFAGTIASVGVQVNGWRVGQAVAVNPSPAAAPASSARGRCRSCAAVARISA